MDIKWERRIMRYKMLHKKEVYFFQSNSLLISTVQVKEIGMITIMDMEQNLYNSYQNIFLFINIVVNTYYMMQKTK